jgi:hypothetical protein
MIKDLLSEIYGPSAVAMPSVAPLEVALLTTATLTAELLTAELLTAELLTAAMLKAATRTAVMLAAECESSVGISCAVQRPGYVILYTLARNYHTDTSFSRYGHG